MYNERYSTSRPRQSPVLMLDMNQKNSFRMESVGESCV